jgi:putative hemolysin
MDELSHAIEMASEDLSEEKTMLEGIVKFSNIQVREIMRPRVDVVALDIKFDLNKVISVIVDSGYSRIPVYEGNFDHIKGI